MKHIRLFEKDKDYVYFLNQGDNIPRPNLLFSKESGQLGYRKNLGTKNKRIAKFLVNENLETQYSRPDTAQDNYRLIHDTSNLKSITINGEDLVVSPPVYGNQWISSEEILEGVTFDGDMFTYDASTNTYILNNPTKATIEMDATKFCIELDGVTNENFDATRYGICILFWGDIDGQYMVSPLLNASLAMFLTYGYFTQSDNTICTTPAFEYELQELMEYFLELNIHMTCIIYDCIEPSIPKHRFGFMTLISGQTSIDVDKPGYYEVEMTFSSSELPIMFFGSGSHYVKSPLMELSDNFFTDMVSLPQFYYTYQFNNRLVIPDSVKGALDHLPSGVTKLTVGSGITELGNSIFEDINQISFKSRIAPTTTSSNIWGNRSRIIEISYPYGADKNYAELMNQSSNPFYTTREYKRLDKNLNGYDIVCVYYASSTTSKTMLLNDAANIEFISVDGGESIRLTSGSYQFTKKGLHVVRFKIYTISQSLSHTFSGCTNLIEVTVGDRITYVGSQTFYNCYNLRKIVLPDTLTTLGNSVFESCSMLEDVVIPSNVEKIPTKAFRNCSLLKNIILPNKLQSIGSEAFEDCINLETIDMPNSVTGIGASVFGSCRKLRTIKWSENLTAIPNNACGGCISLMNLNLPDTIMSIGNYAFNSCASLTDVYIPDSVSSIGGYAFEYCVNLGNIHLHDNITTLGERIFRYCEKLSSITLPNRLTHIPNRAFSFCESLTSIEIPDSVTEIGEEAFHCCYGLTSIKMQNGVTKIGSNAFTSCSRLTDVEIPDSVTEIGSNAFYNCSNLTSVTIGKNVESISISSFPKYEKLSVIISEDNTHYDQREGCTGIIETSTDTLFWANKPTIIPSSIKIIGNSCFSACTSLTSITIPDSVLIIEDYAFSSCRNLVSVEGGNNVHTLGKNAFGSTAILDNQSNNDEQYINNWLMQTNASDSVVIKDNITCISPYAFTNKSEITDITFPSSMRAITPELLRGASQLTSVTLSPNTEVVGEYAFYNCSALTNIYNIENVKTIGTYAFGECKSLTSTGNLASIETMGTSAFTKCTALTSIQLGNKLTTIDNDVFYSCTALNEIVLPNNITTIGDYAFGACTNLQKAIIPDSVTSLGNYVFKGCSKLSDIKLSENLSSFGDFIFSGCTSLPSISGLRYADNMVISITVAQNNVTLQENTRYIHNKAFASNGAITAVTIPSSVSIIKSDACIGSPHLTSMIVDENNPYYDSRNNSNCIIDSRTNELICACTNTIIPNDVTAIGSNAFKFHDISSITIPESVEHIKDGAFYGCTKLRSITMNNTLKTIGEESFSDCAFSNIDLPQSLETIGQSAFKGTKITSITIPSKVDVLKDSTFSGCTSLQEVTLGTNVKSLYADVFRNARLSSITCKAKIAPQIDYRAFRNSNSTNAILRIPKGSDYSSWVDNTSSYYPGYWKWKVVEVDFEETE